MNTEKYIEKLLELARKSEDTVQGALAEMLLEPPDWLLRELRNYLFRQLDYKRVERADDKILQLLEIPGGLKELACSEARFSSGARLDFHIQFEATHRGRLVKRFQFHVRLTDSRRIDMVRIHLNEKASHDPLAVPRCHIHVGDCRAHIPFPIMDPRLILHLICECLEPDFGI